MTAALLLVTAAMLAGVTAAMVLMALDIFPLSYSKAARRRELKFLAAAAALGVPYAAAAAFVVDHAMGLV